MEQTSAPGPRTGSRRRPRKGTALPVLVVALMPPRQKLKVACESPIGRLPAVGFHTVAGFLSPWAVIQFALACGEDAPPYEWLRTVARLRRGISGDGTSSHVPMYSASSSCSSTSSFSTSASSSCTYLSSTSSANSSVAFKGVESSSLAASWLALPPPLVAALLVCVSETQARALESAISLGGLPALARLHARATRFASHVRPDRLVYENAASLERARKAGDKVISGLLERSANHVPAGLHREMMAVQDNAHACMARPGLVLAYQLLLSSVPLRRALGERRHGCTSPELRFADQRAGVPTPLPAASRNPLANAPGASSLLRAYVEPSGCKVLELFLGLVAISPRAPDFLAFLRTARRRPLVRLRCLPARQGRPSSGRVCDECLLALDHGDGLQADAFGCRECCYSCCGDCLKRALPTEESSSVELASGQATTLAPAHTSADSMPPPQRPAKRRGRAAMAAASHVCLWNSDVPCLAERTLVMQRALTDAPPMTAARAPVYARLKRAALVHQAWLRAAEVDDARLRRLEGWEDRPPITGTPGFSPQQPPPHQPLAEEAVRSGAARDNMAATAVTPEVDEDGLGLEAWLKARYYGPPPEYIFECHSPGLVRQWGIE